MNISEQSNKDLEEEMERLARYEEADRKGNIFTRFFRRKDVDAPTKVCGESARRIQSLKVQCRILTNNLEAAEEEAQKALAQLVAIRAALPEGFQGVCMLTAVKDMAEELDKLEGWEEYSMKLFAENKELEGKEAVARAIAEMTAHVREQHALTLRVLEDCAKKRGCLGITTTTG